MLAAVWLIIVAAGGILTAALISLLINLSENYLPWKSRAFGPPFPIMVIFTCALIGMLAYPHMPPGAQPIVLKVANVLIWLLSSAVCLIVAALLTFSLSRYRQNQIAECPTALNRFAIRFWVSTAASVASILSFESGHRELAAWSLLVVAVLCAPVFVNAIVVSYRMAIAAKARYFKKTLCHPQFDLFHAYMDRVKNGASEESADRIVSPFSWSVLPPDALKILCSLGPIMDVGAGTGYVSWLLWQLGADVKAFDISPGINLHNKFHQIKFGWFPVSKLDGEEAAAKYPERVLLFCWPPPEENLMSYRALKAYRGDTVVFIGPASSFGDRWDDSGHQDFQKLLQSEWEPEMFIDLPSWSQASAWKSGHDHLRVMKRRK